MTKEIAREKLDALLERLRLEQTVEDMQAEIEGRTQITSKASEEKAMARVLASLDHFARGEPVGVDRAETPRAPAARAPWETLRATLAWLSVSLDSFAGPATAAPAGYRRAPGTDNRPGAAKARTEAPEELHWIPSDCRALSTGQISLTFIYTGTGTPAEPVIDLRHKGKPIEPSKTTFSAETGTLTVRLPLLDQEVKAVDLAQERENGLLVINVEG